MNIDLTKMSTGAILDRGLKLFKANFVPLVIIVALFTGPLIITASYLDAELNASTGQTTLFENLLGYMEGDQSPTPPEETEETSYEPPSSLRISILYILIMTSIFLVPLTYVCIYKALNDYILGKPVSVGESIKFGRSRYWPLVWAMFLSLMPVMVMYTLLMWTSGLTYTPYFGLYMLLFSILMIITLLLFFPFILYVNLLPCVIALENIAGFNAAKRTIYLLHGNWRRALNAFFVIALIVSIIQWIFKSTGVAICGIIPGIAGVASSAAVTSLFTIIFQPILWTVVFLIYLDLRIRKENYDLEILAQRALVAGPATIVHNPVREKDNDAWN